MVNLLISQIAKTINGRTPKQWTTYFNNRENNANTLVKKGCVIYNEKKINEWFVLSQSHKKNSNVYTIHWLHDLEKWQCNCLQYQKESYVYCKHIRAVQKTLERDSQGLTNRHKVSLDLPQGFLIRMELEIRKNDYKQEKEKPITLTV